MTKRKQAGDGAASKEVGSGEPPVDSKPAVPVEELKDSVAAPPPLPSAAAAAADPASIGMTESAPPNRRWRKAAIFVLLTVAAVVLRSYRIDRPASIVFDEVHFGGFATKYLQGRYFFDVHPPLGKLLFAWTGQLFGYEGHFDFAEIGMEFPNDVPYVPLRMLSALMGALLSPIAFATLTTLGNFELGGFIAGALLMLDIAMAIQFRLILLDSALVFFVAMTVLCYAAFVAIKPANIFGLRWHIDLFFTGIFLGATLSVKMVGLFTVGWIGFHTVAWLWSLLCDSSVPLRSVAYHFLWRAFCLIFVPLAVYIACFHAHFSLLRLSGPGDSHMSLDFQLTLENNVYSNLFADVHYGANLYLLNESGDRQQLLHSHTEKYPEGLPEQQVTGTPIRDINSGWTILPYVQDNMGTVVKGQQTLRLKHESTGAFLRATKDYNAPLTSSSHLVFSSVGALSPHDDLWQVRLGMLADERNSSEPIRSIKSHLLFISKKYGCYLTLLPETLPEWGFNQREVGCSSQISRGAYWQITRNSDPSRSQKEERVGVQPFPFYKKVLELQKLMWTINEQLTSTHPYQSNPGSWPFFERGVTYWYKDHAQIHLLPNPMVWWPAATSIAVFLAIAVVIALLTKRQVIAGNNVVMVNFERAGWLFISAWALHYFPFFLMGRQLFIHHYFPSLYVSVLLLGLCIDYATSKLPSSARWAIAFAIMAATAQFYVHSYPLVAGDAWSAADCDANRWRSSWDITCADHVQAPSSAPGLPT